jgi:hypothetical protein
MAKKKDSDVGQGSLLGGLNGEKPKEVEEKEKKPVDYSPFNYDRSDVVSSFIKEMRLGNVENALYWLRVMRKANEPKNYVVRRLVAFAGEDAWGPEAMAIASDLVTTVNWEPAYDWNIPEQACVHLTLCRKWWEVPEGIAWKKAEMKNERLLKLGKFKPVPRYAMDAHCKSGWALRDQGEFMENRMSGDGNGIAKRIDSFEKFGGFRWEKGLRGWDRYIKEEFDDERGDWKKAKAKSDDYQPGPAPDPKQPKEGYEPKIEYDLKKKVFKVQSESDPTVFYDVDLINGHCTCPHHTGRGAFCKHMTAAKHWAPF